MNNSLKNFNRRKKAMNQGFTLIELMIVVAISGILAAIAIPSYSSYIRDSRRSEAEQRLLRNQQYLERYYHENGSYLDASGNYPTLPFTRSPESGNQLYGIAFETTKISGDDRTRNYNLVATPLGAQASTGNNMWVCLDNDGNLKENTNANCD